MSEFLLILICLFNLMLDSCSIIQKNTNETKSIKTLLTLFHSRKKKILIFLNKFQKIQFFRKKGLFSHLSAVSMIQKTIHLMKCISIKMNGSILISQNS